MYRKMIDKVLFEAMALELFDANRFPAGRYEIVTGRHEIMVRPF